MYADFPKLAEKLSGGKTEKYFAGPKKKFQKIHCLMHNA
jgi:hypothetical protein